jgi:hypothetical protein
MGVSTTAAKFDVKFFFSSQGPGKNDVVRGYQPRLCSDALAAFHL